jgi:hypothetical protein
VTAQGAGEALVSIQTGLVWPDDLDPLAFSLVLGLDGIQGGDGGGVPDVRVGHVDDHEVGITALAGWTGKHDLWLRTQRFDQAATRLAFEHGYDTVTVTLTRRHHLDEAIEADGCSVQFTPVIRRLACLPGVFTLTGFPLAVEIRDWHRFAGNRPPLMSGWSPASTPRTPPE